MRFAIFLFQFLQCVRCASILFMGDSTARHLYHDALVHKCNTNLKNYVDFASVVSPKRNQTFSRTEVFASSSCFPGGKYDGIGYFSHWGVFPALYHRAWKSHTIDGYPGEEWPFLNSTLSIQTALQTWTRSNHGIKIIVFYSNLWDGLRFIDEFKKTTTIEQHMVAYTIAFKKMVQNVLFAFMDKNTTFVFQTTHMPLNHEKSVLTIIHNHVIRNLARIYNVKLLDVDAMLYGIESKTYLIDELHQNRETSLRIIELLDSILKE